MTTLPGAAPAPAPALAAPACANCGMPLTGHFCHECGEPRRDERPLTAARFARQLAHEVTDHDSRTWLTFRTLLTRPGRLTAEYVAGHTRRYLSPLRVFLLAWGAYVFLSSAMGAPGYLERRLEREFAERRRGAQGAEFTRMMSKASRRQRTTPDTMARDIAARWNEYQSSPWIRLLDPLAVAGLLALLYRGRRRNYAEHAVFALHFLAVSALAGVVTMGMHIAFEARPVLDRGATLVQWLVTGAYFFVAARAVYAESRARTAVKTPVFVMGAQAAMTVAPMLAALAATLQVMLL